MCAPDIIIYICIPCDTGSFDIFRVFQKLVSLPSSMASPFPSGSHVLVTSAPYGFKTNIVEHSGSYDKFKRALMFKYLNRLLETHLVGSKLLALRRQWVQQSFHATYSLLCQGGGVPPKKKSLAYSVFQFTDASGSYSCTGYCLCECVYPPPLNQQVLYTIYAKCAPLNFSVLLRWGLQFRNGSQDGLL